MNTAGAPRAALDHLVVMAASLDEGVDWCRSRLGLEPAPGGAHALMGTHNRLLRLDGDAGRPAYLEIIAIDPQARPTREPPLRRWFDMDDPALRAAIARGGPALTHWVVRVEDLAAGPALAAFGLDIGDWLQAHRDTAHGPLRWCISVRPDGRRLLDGCLPTLIRWDSPPPAERLPACGLRLLGLHLQHPEAGRLRQALGAIGLDASAGWTVAEGQARLMARLQTPHGPDILSSCEPCP